MRQPIPGARGQSLAIDLMIAVMIFLLLMAAVLSIWSNSAALAGQQLQESQMQILAEKAMDSLTRSGGIPENWEDLNCGPNTVSNTGLAKADRVMDEKKINMLVWRTKAISNGLVALWRFNGNGSDSSGNGNTAFFYGGALPTGDGLWETKALSVSKPSQQYARAEDSLAMRFTSAQSFTLSAWIYVQSLDSSWAGVVTKSRNAAPWYGIWIDASNKWCFGGYAGGGTYNLCSTANAEAGKWTFVTIVQDGTAGKRYLYVNGALAAQGNTQNANGSGLLYAGGSAGTTEYFNGRIEEVRLYNRALSEEEMRSACEWEYFVKNRLLIGDSNYFFRLVDPQTNNTLQTAAGETVEFGVDPETSKEKNKLMQVKITRPVTFRGGAAVAELVVHRLRT